MSVTYQDLANTSFPDSIDNLVLYVDENISNKPYIDQINAYIQAGNFTGAQAVMTAHPELANVIINAASLQRLMDANIAVQRTWSSSIFSQIANIVKNKGAYNSTTLYPMFSIVTYNYQAYMNIATSTPKGTLPTNTTYWTVLTLQGIAGTGMAFYTSWSSTQAYKLQDCVPYNNNLYVCIQAHTNQNPATATAYWSSIITIPKQIPISSSQPSGQGTDELWYEILS